MSLNPQTDRGAGTDSRLTEQAVPNVQDHEEIIDTGGEEDKSDAENAARDVDDELPQQMEFQYDFNEPAKNDYRSTPLQFQMIDESEEYPSFEQASTVLLPRLTLDDQVG